MLIPDHLLRKEILEREEQDWLGATAARAHTILMLSVLNPAQSEKVQALHFRNSHSQVRWPMPVTPATWEVEAGGQGT